MRKNYSTKSILRLASNFERYAQSHDPEEDEETKTIPTSRKNFIFTDESEDDETVPINESGVVKKRPAKEILIDQSALGKIRFAEERIRFSHLMLTNPTSGILIHPGLAKAISDDERRALESFRETHYGPEDEFKFDEFKDEFKDDFRSKLLEADVENYGISDRIAKDKKHVYIIVSVLKKIEPLIKNSFLKILTDSKQVPSGSAIAHGRRKRMILSQLEGIKENVFEAMSALNEASYMVSNGEI